jgi:hypothetical protein
MPRVVALTGVAVFGMDTERLAFEMNSEFKVVCPTTPVRSSAAPVTATCALLERLAAPVKASVPPLTIVLPVKNGVAVR